MNPPSPHETSECLSWSNMSGFNTALHAEILPNYLTVIHGYGQTNLSFMYFMTVTHNFNNFLPEILPNLLHISMCNKFSFRNYNVINLLFSNASNTYQLAYHFLRICYLKFFSESYLYQFSFERLSKLISINLYHFLRISCLKFIFESCLSPPPLFFWINNLCTWINFFWIILFIKCTNKLK